MYKNTFCDSMIKKQKVKIDIMNKNAIVSLAMLYALWDSKRHDLLEVLRPFVMYAVGNVTKVESYINVDNVASYLEERFGYKNFQTAVVNRILNRETSNSIKTTGKNVEKHNGKYRLIKDIAEFITDFDKKHLDCKSRSDQVSKELMLFFNQRRVCKRDDYTQDEIEKLLLAFFERQGGSIVRSIENLKQLTSKDNEIDYFIGRFILNENKNKSVIMDYIMELVKGYFVTTALYLQVENPDITTASFSDVTFFLDTRLLLAYLGFKTEQENNSVQEMIRSIKSSGAKLACFSYNLDEVNSILDAYKFSKVYGSKRASTITLEYFDENRYSSTHVEAAQRAICQQLKFGNIQVLSFQDALANHGVLDRLDGIFDDERIKNILLSIKPNYRIQSLPDDLSAINTIARIREGKKYPYIEKCKAVFITSNSILVSATKQYVKENTYDLGFPVAITSEDLCVIAWLKDFEHSDNLPKMRLLENVLAAVTPTHELMEAYFSHLENLEKTGVVNEEEVALLRVDLYAKQELMEFTHGNVDNLTEEIIAGIREKIREESITKGVSIGKTEAMADYKKALEENKNKVCDKAEKEIREKFAKAERIIIIGIKLLSWIIVAAFLWATISSFISDCSQVISWAMVVITAVSGIQAIVPFFSKESFMTKFAKRWLGRIELKAVDKRKEKYLSLFEESTNIE